MKASDYLIGANDAGGINPPAENRRSPALPYLSRSVYENEAAKATKIYFIISLLSRGVGVFDIHPELFDIAPSVRRDRANAGDLTALVTFGYNLFGSGKAFNSIDGLITYYSNKSFHAAESQTLAEDVYLSVINDSLQDIGRGVSEHTNSVLLEKVNCPSIAVTTGFMTNLIEARLMLDPDWCRSAAEAAAAGVCLNIRAAGSEDVSRPALKAGDTGRYVKIAQYYLILSGYDIMADGIFGSETKDAVAAFQSFNGLAESGAVSANTWMRLELTNPESAVLTYGNKGSAVQYMQQKLESKLYPLKVDGFFGIETLEQLKAFQSESGLTADGVAGPMTWSRLKQLASPRD